MKPRPLVATFVAPARSISIVTNFQCRRTVHVHNIALASRTYMRRHTSQRPAQETSYTRRPANPGQRYASSSAAPAKKTGYGVTMAPPLHGKASKTNVSVKILPKAKPLPLAKSPSYPVAVATKSSTSQPTADSTAKRNEKLNPPSFTYAPEITVPARGSDQGLASWLWKTGRIYINFYKAGVSNVRQTSKLAKQLREKTNKSPSTDTSEILSRAEWQIVRRSRKDVLRLPAFGALVLLLGEWLPLVVMYITPVIPEACRIPQQVKRDLVNQDQRRSRRLMRTRLMTAAPPPERAGPTPVIKSVADTARLEKARYMNMRTLYFSAIKYDTFSRVWDWAFITPPRSVLERGLQAHFDYLAKDDALIARDGGYEKLSFEEVKRACVERGIDKVGELSERQLRSALAGEWYNDEEGRMRIIGPGGEQR